MFITLGIAKAIRVVQMSSGRVTIPALIMSEPTPKFTARITGTHTQAAARQETLSSGMHQAW